MDDPALVAFTFDALRDSWATRTIEERLRARSFDRAFTAHICRLMYAKCGFGAAQYRAALGDFIALSEEFVVLQMELDRTGRYRYAAYEDVRREVYDEPAVMDGRYLNGLFLSQALWPNHARIHAYYASAFCAPGVARGTLLEVPAGTGIFGLEFARRNPDWPATSFDLSESAVRFSREIARLGGAEIDVRRADVFALPAGERYDRLVCGELLEHLEDPRALVDRLAELLADDGRLFLTTAIWAAAIDHLYLYETVAEARAMLETRFSIESELALAVFDGHAADEPRTPVNYACVLAHRR